MRKSNRRPESSTGTAGRTGSNEARRPLRGGYLEILGGLSPCAKLQSTRELLSELRSRLLLVDPHRGQTGNEKSEFLCEEQGSRSDIMHRYSKPRRRVHASELFRLFSSRKVTVFVGMVLWMIRGTLSLPTTGGKRRKKLICEF